MSGEPRRSNATKPLATAWIGLGPRIKALRLAQGMSMDDLAAKANVSKATISRFERSYDTTFSVVVAICEVLGLHFEALVCEHKYVCRFCGEALDGVTG